MLETCRANAKTKSLGPALLQPFKCHRTLRDTRDEGSQSNGPVLPDVGVLRKDVNLVKCEILGCNGRTALEAYNSAYLTVPRPSEGSPTALFVEAGFR